MVRFLTGVVEKNLFVDGALQTVQSSVEIALNEILYIIRSAGPGTQEHEYIYVVFKDRSVPDMQLASLSPLPLYPV